ncbi:solute carrier family 49 member 4 homolog isoform X2 [Macrobrachium nipponense]|uniref:solute carrier family 49 member 4 homolog isoform X2 n=1 Tax=Macrobrachium nipponense TaxID=159736 RepID=UPI0030C7DF89
MEAAEESSPLLATKDESPQSSSGSVTVHPVIPSSYQNGDSEDTVDGSGSSYREVSKREEEVPGQNINRAYPSRFWILGVFSFIAFFQCLQWNTWGPISESVDAAFSGWKSSTVAMMANWGTITFVLFITPMCWLMNEKGLRTGVFACAIMIAAGTVLRVLALTTNSNEVFTISCHLCAILVGTAGTLVMAAPPMIAAEWFPPKERTTATAIGQAFNQLGNAGSYLEPIFVRSPADGTPEEIRGDIKVLMYAYAGIAAAVLLAVFFYYPSKPPTPPSLSSSVERLQFWDSIKKILRNRDVIIVTLAYGISVGIPSSWIAVFNYSLQAMNIHQDEATWIGLAVVIVSSTSALVSGRLTDLVYGHLRVSLIIIMLANLGCFYWFYLITYGSITVVKWQIYFTSIAAFSLNFATCPLFFELAVESAYPCPEILVGGLLTGMNNFVGLLFLFLFFIPNIGYSWVTYILLSTSSLSVILIVIIREDYSRSNMDRGTGFQSSYQPI